MSCTDFNQPQGLQMNPENRWIKKAEMIPWDTIEKEYAKLFPSKTQIRSWSAAHKKRRHNKSIDCSQHHINEHRPACGDAFAPSQIYLVIFRF